jgi:hypothetical protein
VIARLLFTLAPLELFKPPNFDAGSPKRLLQRPLAARLGATLFRHALTLLQALAWPPVRPGHRLPPFGVIVFSVLDQVARRSATAAVYSFSPSATPCLGCACGSNSHALRHSLLGFKPSVLVLPTVPIANLMGSVGKTVCRSVGYREFEIPFSWLASPDLQAGSSHANFRSRLRRSWRTHAVAQLGALV